MNGPFCYECNKFSLTMSFFIQWQLSTAIKNLNFEKNICLQFTKGNKLWKYKIHVKIFNVPQLQTPSQK